jgi:ABC-type glutathione transport system ATPase component
MDVVRELADRIIVLHNGTLVADGEPAEVIASPVVQEAYLGVSSQAAKHQQKPTTATPKGRCSLSRLVHTHIGAYHILHGVDLACPRAADHAAGPQRRRQDHHAAHHHGPVAGVAGQGALQRQDITPCTRRRSRA